MKKILLSSFFFLLISPAFSQTTPSSDAEEAKNIKRLLELMGTTKLAEQVVTTMISQFKQSMPEVPEDFWEKFQKEINYEELVDLVVPIYEKHFTNDDILKLIEFYQTPTGQKYINESPAIMQESMQAGQQWGQQTAEKILKELDEEKENKKK